MSKVMPMSVLRNKKKMNFLTREEPAELKAQMEHFCCWVDEVLPQNVGCSSIQTKEQGRLSMLESKEKKTKKRKVKKEMELIL